MASKKEKKLLRNYAVVFWVLLGLFLLRVLGQVLVEFFGVSFLPPSRFWMSGYVSYGVLLAAQVFAIGLLLKVCVDFTRGGGYFVEKAGWKEKVLYAGVAYFAVMAVARPFIEGHVSIPSVFHGVLALFVITAGVYYRR